MNKTANFLLLLFLILLCFAGIAHGQGDTGFPENKSPTQDPAVTAFKLLPNEIFFKQLTHNINQAENEIIFAYFLCKPGKSNKNRPTAILNALIKARKRGVNVEVLLDRSGYFEHVDIANNRAAAILKQAGIKVLFDSPKKTTHVKMAVIDQRFCFIGSHNLTQSALTYNNELSLLIDSPKLARELLDYWQNIR